MIKRLIFDLDNTLIDWKEEYDYYSISKTLELLNISYNKELCKKIINLETEYEKNIKFFNRKDLINFINDNLKQKLPYSFVDVWIRKLADCVPEKLEKNIYETLEYLFGRYELVILTNWFEESQIRRLEKVDILKYFKEFYGGEKYVKPNKEAFLQAIGNKKINECAFIGDDFKIDIVGAKNAGMKNIVWLDNKNESEKNDIDLSGIMVIRTFDELKNIF